MICGLGCWSAPLVGARDSRQRCRIRRRASRALDLVAQDLRRTGYKRVAFRSDGEASLQAFIRAAARRWDCEVVAKKGAPGDHASHGPVDNDVTIAKGQLHTLKSALKARIGAEAPADHPIIT